MHTHRFSYNFFAKGAYFFLFILLVGLLVWLYRNYMLQDALRQYEALSRLSPTQRRVLVGLGLGVVAGLFWLTANSVLQRKYALVFGSQLWVRPPGAGYRAPWEQIRKIRFRRTFGRWKLLVYLNDHYPPNLGPLGKFRLRWNRWLYGAPIVLPLTLMRLPGATPNAQAEHLKYLLEEHLEAREIRLPEGVDYA